MAIALALILVLIVIGSVMFHLLSPWWLTPIASNWNYIDGTISLTFWITGIGYIAIMLFMAYCVFRFRHQEGQAGALSAGEQSAGMVARHRDHGGRRGSVRAGVVRMVPIRQRPERGGRDRGRGSTMEWSFRLPGKGRPARHV